jgi:DNA-binding response OmpR family regulator
MQATKINKRILIVDDEPNIAMAIDFLMSDAGYETAVAANGREAIAKMSSFEPHVVILDVMMPEMDGFEAARAIRQNEAFAHVQLIFLTAKVTDPDRATGYGSGGDLYLTKPFDNDELLAMVEEVVEFSE